MKLDKDTTSNDWTQAQLGKARTNTQWLSCIRDVGLWVGRMQGWESESESVLVGPSGGCLRKIKVLLLLLLLLLLLSLLIIHR